MLIFTAMISFRIYNEHGALNSAPILDAVRQGMNRCGLSEISRNEDMPVIWSVLWSGRMLPNRQIYKTAQALRKPVMIIEVGNLLRGRTWRICLDNVNRMGYFGQGEIDPSRASSLGVALRDPQVSRKREILIATQHEKSLQWEAQPTMVDWIKRTVETVRAFSDRPIVIRPHPRSRIHAHNFGPNTSISIPKKLLGTYDDFDIDYNYHCVINHNSGPAVQAAISGTPVICDPSSLAYPLSDKFTNLESLHLPDRRDWFNDLCHTEWTVEEIARGVPFDRLLPELKIRLNH